MSTNISHIEILSSTLRISEKNAKKARRIDGLPEIHPFDDLEFGADGFASIPLFSFSGEGSGRAFPGVFRKVAVLTEGDADLILTWEGGEFSSGVRIRSGKMKECDVVMTLAPDKVSK